INTYTLNESTKNFLFKKQKHYNLLRQSVKSEQHKEYEKLYHIYAILHMLTSPITDTSIDILSNALDLYKSLRKPNDNDDILLFLVCTCVNLAMKKFTSDSKVVGLILSGDITKSGCDYDVYLLKSMGFQINNSDGDIINVSYDGKNGTALCVS